MKRFLRLCLYAAITVAVILVAVPAVERLLGVPVDLPYCPPDPTECD